VLRGTEPIHPAYLRLSSLLEELGDDVTVDRTGTGAQFSRGVRFAVLEPVSPTRLDLGLVLPGAASTERLRPAEDAGGLTHRVSLAHEDEIDAELTGWLRDAYDGAAR
jgi:hypothetical protein